MIPAGRRLPSITIVLYRLYRVWDTNRTHLFPEMTRHPGCIPGMDHSVKHFVGELNFPARLIALPCRAYDNPGGGVTSQICRISGGTASVRFENACPNGVGGNSEESFLDRDRPGQCAPWEGGRAWRVAGPCPFPGHSGFLDLGVLQPLLFGE